MRLLRGHRGRNATAADIARLPRAQKPTVRAHVNGLTGTTGRSSRIAANNVAGNWAQVFGKAGLNLPPANVAIVASQVQSCGSTQITAGSGTDLLPEHEHGRASRSGSSPTGSPRSGTER